MRKAAMLTLSKIMQPGDERVIVAVSGRLEHQNWSVREDAVEALTLSAFYTGSAAHGERAAALLRAWFLDPATRMNPNADCKCRGSSVASLKSRMARSLKGATARSCTRHPGQVRRAGDWPHRLCKRVADPPRLRGAAGVARALAGVRRGGSEAVDGVVARLDAGLA